MKGIGAAAGELAGVGRAALVVGRVEAQLVQRAAVGWPAGPVWAQEACWATTGADLGTCSGDLQVLGRVARMGHAVRVS